MECPYCRETIQDGAIKCKHCGSDLTPAGAMSNVTSGYQADNSQSPFSYYTGAWKQFAVFQGRARRREYWFFILFNLLVAFGLGIIDAIIGTFDEQVGMGLFGGLYTLAVLIPSIAISVRRLHDTDRTGWWFLLCFIPLIGPIVLLVFMCLDSSQGRNSFGANPKVSMA